MKKCKKNKKKQTQNIDIKLYKEMVKYFPYCVKPETTKVFILNWIWALHHPGDIQMFDLYALFCHLIQNIFRIHVCRTGIIHAGVNQYIRIGHFVFMPIDFEGQYPASHLNLEYMFVSPGEMDMLFDVVDLVHKLKIYITHSGKKTKWLGDTTSDELKTYMIPCLDGTRSAFDIVSYELEQIVKGVYDVQNAMSRPVREQNEINWCML